MSEKNLFISANSLEYLLRQYPHQQYAMPDTMLPTSTVTLAVSRELCLATCEKVLASSTTGRLVVAHTAISVFGIPDGWDSGAALESLLLRRKPETQEPFYSLGTTEKVQAAQIERMRRLAPLLTTPAIMSLIGPIEELDIRPVDGRSFRSIPLELIIYPFAVEVWPIGIIFNLDRQEAPIALSFFGRIITGDEPKSRDRVDIRFGWNPKTCPVDSWAKLVVKFLDSNGGYLNYSDNPPLTSLSKSEFNRISARYARAFDN